MKEAKRVAGVLQRLHNEEEEPSIWWSVLIFVGIFVFFSLAVLNAAP
jgi:hypothetical protein